MAGYNFYWITFEDFSAGCVQANTAKEAMEIAVKKTGKDVADFGSLPYPATPMLTPTTHPTFCHSPETCQKRHSCPHRYACSE